MVPSTQVLYYYYCYYLLRQQIQSIIKYNPSISKALSVPCFCANLVFSKPKVAGFVHLQLSFESATPQ